MVGSDDEISEIGVRHSFKGAFAVNFREGIYLQNWVV